MASYAWRLASITGWGYDEIMYELPFAAGLQIIAAEDYSKGRGRPWKNQGGGPAKVDTLAQIEEQFR